MKATLYSLFRGIGQVMLQENALSGLLMTIGIACSSWTLALLALIGCATGMLTAQILRYDPEDIRRGLYGFNGTLTGIATGVFLHITPLSMLLLVLFSALSTLFTRLLSRQTLLPGFTAPFIGATWLLLLLATTLLPQLLLPATAGTPATEFLPWDAFCLNFGQVMFQGSSLYTGLFFLIAILIHAPLQALYSVWGALLPLFTAWLEGMSIDSLNAGLSGYNGVLCAIALAGKTPGAALWSTVAILLSTFLQMGGMNAGLITLTAPFVLATWIVILLQKATKKTPKT